ncbi:hypothetical protein RB195_012859 [Necator americanus]|uniref:Uncharacterized protein n=1 Tax=Necator americanus TaxID=51031 RepID=A0ABR1DT46_NECAM
MCSGLAPAAGRPAVDSDVRSDSQPVPGAMLDGKPVHNEAQEHDRVTQHTAHADVSPCTAATSQGEHDVLQFTHY